MNPGLEQNPSSGKHRIPTAGQLNCHSAVIDGQVRTSVVASRFEQQADLPGIIVLQNGALLGVIPRTRFLERLSHKFWPELFLPKPVSQVGEVLRPNPLVLTEDSQIAEASSAALQRQGDEVFEPIVVHRHDGSYQLLDIHTLMLEQTRLLEFFNQQAQSDRATAEAASESKSQFLANMSHEIRTPLTAIIGFGEELLDPVAPDSQRREAIELIVRNGKHLLQLVNEILDLSKIEAGRLEVEHVPVCVREILDDVLAALRIRAREKNLDLRIAYQTAIPDQIKSDPTRVRQILMNLIGNAIKFTERGSVTVSVRMPQNLDSLQLATDGTSIFFDVTDTGIGIDPGSIRNLFQPFTQADVTTTRRFGGTGLGLTISRRLSELLGGDLTVSSVMGVGSTFTVSIATGPLRDVQLLDQPAVPPTSIQVENAAQSDEQPLNARILLVDDAPDNRLLISRILERNGASIDTAENGREGADRAWHARTEGTPYDIVLMDMQMPVLDGYGATRELRARGYELPIVALTANAQPADLQKCLHAGCDAHASKPIDRTDLFATIRQLTPANPASAATAHPTDNLATREQSIQADCSVLTHHRESAVASRSGTAGAVDRSKALSRMGGSAELVREVAGMVIELLPAWLDEMQQHRQSGDFDSLKRLAHTLKTSAENVGASGLADAAWNLETSLSNQELASSEQLLQQLIRCATPVVDELEEWLAETSSIA